MNKKELKRKATVVVFILVSSLILITGIVSAEWAITNGISAWDVGQTRWENGNIDLTFDNMPQAFYHKIVASNGDEFNGTQVADACGPSTTTTYAGTAEIGLYHTDTDGDSNAPGFQSSGSYQLVSCDLDPNGNANDSETPLTVLDTCITDDGNADGVVSRCEISNQDAVVSCTTGNCKEEIVTTVSINLDADCDGQIDSGYDQDVCLYWNAEKPPNFAPFWQGNIQGRISDGGGDKTINFKVTDPTAINLQDFTSNANMSWLLVVVGMLLWLSAFTLNTVRKTSQR